MKKTKYLHIAIIILGIIFISIPVFHSNLWFDESYSVGMANKSFIDIWNIGSNDVHPILYYWILHIIYLIFGNYIYFITFNITNYFIDLVLSLYLNNSLEPGL